ncbi:MAG: hypothetical protein AAF705_13645, partial [Bacteroidota bacterium]
IWEGPCFDLSTAQTADFQFAYHMWGSHMGSLNLEISLDNGTSWDTLWSRSGDLTDQWFDANISLDAFAGQTIKLRFYGITGPSFRSDMAIDDLSLTINTPAPSFSCVNTVSSFPYTESFESGTGLWVEETATNIWRINAGWTSSSNTGPTSALDGSWYMYTEASTPNYPSKTENFDSPCFDLSQQSVASFQFIYHMYGATIGTLELLVQTENNLNWVPIWSRSGPNGDAWYQADVDLSGFTGQRIKLRFKVTTGNGYTGDIAIDKFSLNTTPVQVTAGCSTTITNFPYTESFESGLGDWSEQAGLSLWARRTGATPSYAGGFGTGVSSAFDGNYYMYSEGDNISGSNNTAYLTGPCFDLTNASSASFNFHYAMYRYIIFFPYFAGLSLEVSTNNGASWTSVWSKTGYQGGWLAATVDLSNYIGQTIQLRFQSLHQPGQFDDVVIDNLRFYAPQTPISGTIQASVEFPQTTTCTDPSFRNCCEPETLTAQAIPNVGIDIEGINGSLVSTVTDGTFGTFGATVPGGAVTLKPTINSTNWKNGLSTLDIIAVQGHVNGTTIIDCPFQRIAADIDSDGDIDADDVSTLQALVVESITSVSGSENWKFVSKGLAMPTDLNPDLRFIADFWNPAAEDNSGDQYPFKAKLNIPDGTEYTYSGATSWMQELDATLNTICITADYGFYAVKTGDINGSANYTAFSDPYGPPAPRSANDPNRTRVAQMDRQANQSLLRSGGNNKYEVRIVADAPEPIIAYQMGIFFDDEVMSLGKINPNQEYLKQSEAKNFGQARKGLKGGEFSTVWIADLKEDPRGKRLDNTITLMSFEFQSKLEKDAISNAFHLDNGVTEIQFFN